MMDVHTDVPVWMPQTDNTNVPTGILFYRAITVNIYHTIPTFHKVRISAENIMEKQQNAGM